MTPVITESTAVIFLSPKQLRELAAKAEEKAKTVGWGESTKYHEIPFQISPNHTLICQFSLDQDCKG